MGVVLKKCGRKNRRYLLTGTVYIAQAGSKKAYPTQVRDLSIGGLSFYIRDEIFNEKALVDVHFHNPEYPDASMEVRGVIISAPEETTHSNLKVYRYSVRFETAISEAKLLKLLETFDLQSPIIGYKPLK